jgi:thiamine pyrophosphate-dependent acetolactate synthase large subunit-like protein
MTEHPPGGALDRRGFIQLAAAGAGLAEGLRAAVAQTSESSANITRQPNPAFGDDLTTADIIVETLIAWGATCAFGVVGDGINSLIEALRKRRDRIRYIGVRHEEAAAFMASGFAKHTGQLGVCLGTTGPGAIHLLNGLYDAPKRQSVTVVGDGGFAMLMAELSTAVAHNVPIKIILLKNNSLAEVKFEQQEIGNPEYGCDLPPIDFVAFARACGADGFRCAQPEEVRPAIQAAVNSGKAALVEAVVDVNEKPAKPDELRV